MPVRNVQVVRKILGTSQTTLPTAVGDGGEVELYLDEYGRIGLSDTFTVDTATISVVASSATNVTLASANTARQNITLYNGADKSCYVKMGATATSSSFTVKMVTNSYYEALEYTGIIDGIWEAGPTGNMLVTEF